MNNKKYSLTNKVLVGIFLMIFLVATISAMEVDNAKFYDSKTKTITIKNNFGLPFISEKVADIQLTSASIEYVMRGKDRKVAEFILSNYQKDYDTKETTALKKIEMYDLKKKSKKIDRDFVYKYRITKQAERGKWIKICSEQLETNGSISNICTTKQNGTETYNIYEWKEFKKLSELPEGDFIIGIFTEVYPNDNIEWIPTFFGIKIEEWASWSDSFNVGLQTYNNFNEGAGAYILERSGNMNLNMTMTISGTQTWVNGISGGAFQFIRNNATTFNNLSIVGTAPRSGFCWVVMNTTAGSAGVISMGKNKYAVGEFLDFSIAPTALKYLMLENDGDPAINSPAGSFDQYDSTWALVGYTYNGSLMKIYHNDTMIQSGNMVSATTNGTLSYGGSKVQGGRAENITIDECGYWNRTLSDAEVVSLYDGAFYDIFVILHAPADGYNGITNQNITFNANFSSLDNFVNSTLIIYNSSGVYKVNSTLITGTSNSSSLSISTFEKGFYNWTYKVCTAGGTCNIGFNRSLNVYDYKINSVLYNNSAYDTSTQTFIINTTNAFSSTTATFYYNNTAYTPTTTSYDKYYIFTNNINVPEVTPDYVNRSFYWALGVNNGSDVTYVNSSFYNQTTIPLTFGPCNDSNLQHKYLNFTFKDETTLENINATISNSNWEYYLGSGLVNKSFTFSDSNEHSSYAFCSNQSDETIRLSYDTNYLWGSAYPQRITATSGTSFAPIGTDTTLYLLSTTYGVYATFQVVSTGNQMITGAHIIVTRSIGATTTTVGDAYTDSSGTTTFFLNSNYDHTVTVSAPGYSTQTLTIKPIGTTYTVTMSGGGDYVYYSLLEGVGYNIYPPSGIISEGVHNFTFEVVSGTYSLQNCSMSIRNTTTVLYNVYNCRNSTYGFLSQESNITKYPKLFGNYSVKINGTWIIIENDARWVFLNKTFNYSTTWNLKAALSDTYALPEWGSDPMKSDFSRIVFFFIFFAIALSALNFFTGYDTAYPGSFVYIMTGAVILLSGFNGVSGPGFFYLNGATNLAFVHNNETFARVIDNWLIAFCFFLISGIYFFTTMRRYQG